MEATRIWTRRYLDGETFRQIASDFGVDESVVRRSVSRAGVPVRPRGPKATVQPTDVATLWRGSLTDLARETGRSRVAATNAAVLAGVHVPRQTRQPTAREASRLLVLFGQIPRRGVSQQTVWASQAGARFDEYVRDLYADGVPITAAVRVVGTTRRPRLASNG